MTVVSLWCSIRVRCMQLGSARCRKELTFCLCPLRSIRVPAFRARLVMLHVTRVLSVSYNTGRGHLLTRVSPFGTRRLCRRGTMRRSFRRVRMREECLLTLSRCPLALVKMRLAVIILCVRKLLPQLLHLLHPFRLRFAPVLGSLLLPCLRAWSLPLTVLRTLLRPLCCRCMFNVLATQDLHALHIFVVVVIVLLLCWRHFLLQHLSLNRSMLPVVVLPVGVSGPRQGPVVYSCQLPPLLLRWTKCCGTRVGSSPPAHWFRFPLGDFQLLVLPDVVVEHIVVALVQWPGIGNCVESPEHPKALKNKISNFHCRPLKESLI